MTVTELIEALSQFPGDMRVIAVADDAGNDFMDVYAPQLFDCIEDEGFRCGYYPVDEDDIADGEYDGIELVKMVVM